MLPPLVCYMNSGLVWPATSLSSKLFFLEVQ
jgi:hypothetical protein